MLTVLALIAIAAGLLLSAGSLASLWIDSRKQDNDRNSTDAGY
jgi:hypothetical protein